MKRLLLFVLLTLSACDAMPRDPDGTSQRIAASKRFSVGVMVGSPAAVTSALIAELERQTGSRAMVSQGAGEPMVTALADGRTDVVIGSFAQDSPWSTEIAFGPPLKSTGPKDRPIEVKAAMRNGENRWIMTVERASRAVSADARAQ